MTTGYQRHYGAQGKSRKFSVSPGLLVSHLESLFSIALAGCLYFVICENGLGTTITINVKTVNFPLWMFLNHNWNNCFLPFPRALVITLILPLKMN